MARNSVSEWSETASNNTDVGGINIGEDCAAANVNNAMREIMAQIARTGFPSFEVAAYGDISGTDNTALLEEVVAAMPATGGVIILPEGDFTLANTVDFDVPEDTHVLMWGTRIVCTHDGVALEVNSPYDPNNANATTKRRVHFWGGNFENTNGTKTASEAIRAYGMRMCAFNQTYFTGFYNAVRFSAKDTYIFNQCYFFANEISLYNPSIALAAGDKTLNVELNNCHFSNNGVTNAVLIEDAIAGFRVFGGSFNGACSGGVLLFKDNALLQSEGIEFVGTHFEQFDSNGAVVFSESNGNGFYNVKITGEFTSAATGHKGVIMDYCRNVMIDAQFRDGSGGSTEVGITVDTDSRDVRIHHGASFSGSTVKFLNMATPIEVATGARKYITGIPSMVMKPASQPISGFQESDTFSSVTETTIDMETKITQLANWPLKPLGYMAVLAAQDSASAASSNLIADLRDATGTAGTFAGLRVTVSGIPDDEFRTENGFVPCDENGDISYRTVASGTDTMGVQIYINGAVF